MTLLQLGLLEREVLKYLWSHPELDAKSVHAYFKKKRGGSLNTIQSTLDRLFKKGFLERYKSSHAYVYYPSSSKADFVGQAIINLTSEIASGDPALLAATFTSISDSISDAELDALSAQIALLKQQRESE